MDLFLITIIMIVGSCLHASAGFGSGLVAVPLLGLINSQLLPGPILFAYLFLTVFMTWREREHLDPFHIRHTVGGLFIGTFIGAVILVNIDSQAFGSAAALMVLTGVCLSFVKASFLLNRFNIQVTGTAAGLMSTLAGLSGPPLALLLQFQPAPFVRANLAAAFIFSSLLSIAALQLTDNFSIQSIYLGFCLVPGMYMGYFLGQPVAKRISQQHSRYAILVISTLSALSLMLKAFF